MIIDNFYSAEIIKFSEEAITASISLNDKHDIYKGHFPGQPIVPGVCQVLIVKELLSDCIGKDLQLISSKRIKFLSMLDPTQTSDLTAEIKFKRQESDFQVSAVLSSGLTIFLKLKGTYSGK